MADVRYDPIGSLNRLICWVFSGNRPSALRRLVSIIFHVELPILQHPLRMPHPYQIVVNPSAKLNKNITIYQGVTIGSKREGNKSGAPVIENDVVIFPNAVVIGGVTIGAGAIIGPNAVVVNDVPPGITVVGNPARPIRSVSDNV
jgi:serine acetyltransferase